MSKIKSIIKDKRNQKIIIILLAIFTTIALSLSLDIVTNKDINQITSTTNYVSKILLKFNYSLELNVSQSLFVFICLMLLLKKCFFRDEIENKGNKIYKMILSILFSFFMVFGYSYMKINSWDMIFYNTFQLFKAIIKGIGYYIIFRALINYLFDILFENIKIKESTNKIYNFIFIKHSFIIPLLIIIACWLPYIVAYYPGTLFQDSSNQIKQYFGYDIPSDSATDSVNLIDENVKITNHHPVLHTVILGMCMQVGKAVGNDNIGVFCYTILQILFLSSTFAYIINFMKKIKVPNSLRIFALLMFAMLPIIPIYAMEITKDIPFTCLLIIYIIKLYNLIKNANSEKLSIKKCMSLILINILIALFRNNGLYVIILSLPFVAIIDKINRRKIIIISVIVIAIYEAFTSILLPKLKIPAASVREALSIPFQQTARYVKEHRDEVTEEERKKIDKVLEYDTLSERYKPIDADPVKNKYNKNATKEDLGNYLKVWFGQFFKHPTTYIQATMNNVYGYFYPESQVRQYTTGFMINSHKAINETGGFNYGYIENLKGLRKTITQLVNCIKILPVTSWIVNIAFNMWIILIIFAYLLYSKKYRYIIYIMPLLSIVLMCIVSPVNAFYRYAIPCIFTMPLTIAIFIDIINQVNKEKGEVKNEK